MYYSTVTWWKVSLTQSAVHLPGRRKKGFGKLFNNSNIYFCCCFKKKFFYFLGNSIAAAHFWLDTQQKKTHRVTICNESK